MHISYPSHITWKKTISEDILAGFGSGNQKKLKATIGNHDNTGITHTIEPLTEDSITWFIKRYHEMLDTKENAKVSNIHATTLGKEGVSYYILTVYEQNEPIGATIFSKRATYLSIAYRTYCTTWTNRALQASPALYAEFLITQYAQTCGYTKISHGRDRNLYGISSAIGLATFKLSVGCIPSIPRNATFETIDLDMISKNTLIIQGTSDTPTPLTATLMTTEVDAQKYLQATKYPKALIVQTRFRVP